MDEKITVEFNNVDEVNTLAGLLGQLPYIQVFQLLDHIGKQVGPQIRAIEEKKAETEEAEKED